MTYPPLPDMKTILAGIEANVARLQELCQKDDETIATLTASGALLSRDNMRLIEENARLREEVETLKNHLSPKPEQP